MNEDLRQLKQGLFKPVSNASLVVFRILFGLIMLIEAYRYWSKGWIDSQFIAPSFQFKYFGFEWVQPLSGNGMYWIWALIALSAAMIMLGLMYRLACLLFLLSFSYIFLIDQTHYLNHFYFVILLALLCYVTPLHRRASLDAYLNPQLASRQTHAWCLWLFIAQMEVMYIYAGIVKINPDWLQLQPLSMWMAAHQDLPLIGPLMDETWVVAMAAYGSIALHVLGAPLLLIKRTRIYVFAAYCLFHSLNHSMFNIGIFPWLTLAGTLLFFEPDWPIRLKQRLLKTLALNAARKQPPEQQQRWQALASELPVDGEPVQASTTPVVSQVQKTWIITCIALWLAYQILMPLRHILYPGNPSWTEEGHRFAWQMKLRSKRGDINFRLMDVENGRYWLADPRLDLNRKQIRVMRCRPDMILQYAHFLAQRYEQIRGYRPEVRVDAQCSLNGRPKQALIDPDRNLAEIPRSLRHADWILPLTTPLQ